MDRKKVLINLIWRFFERCGAQGIKIVLELILARFLLPSDYGIVALMTIFISIIQIFVDSGLGNALIQKKNADNIDFSTVFFFNIFFCCMLYFFLFVCAPLIASFYKNDNITQYIRFLGITVLISGIKNVQQAYVSKNMLFKKFFFSTLGGTIAAAVVGIIMAYCGFGVWALIVQHVLNTAVDTIILWITVKWRPVLKFSFYRLKGLFSYGWKLLLSSLISMACNNINQLVIGKIYSSADLAYYNQGDKFPQLIIGNINSAIDSVLLPAMSTVQDDKNRIRAITSRSIKTSSYIILPIMFGLAFTAKTLISVILTDKWLSCVPYIRIFCFTYMFYPIHTANLNAIKAMGRSDIYLKLEIIKKILSIALLIVSMNISVKAMAVSMLIVSIISQLINSWPNFKLLNYKYLNQLKDILPSLCLSAFMGLCIHCITYFDLNNIVTLLIQILGGILIYITGSLIFKIEAFQYILGFFKRNKTYDM